MTTTNQGAADAALRTTLVNAQEIFAVQRTRFERWWAKQVPRMKLALALAGLFAAASFLDLAAAGFRRITATHLAPAASAAAAVPALTLEAAPNDVGKTWTVTKVWQGSGSHETEAFTVGAHWRVDWLFSPSQAGAVLQVYVFSADGRTLLNLAANTQRTGADTSFWMGPGTYFLKINTTGGDWKLDVQDLH